MSSPSQIALSPWTGSETRPVALNRSCPSEWVRYKVLQIRISGITSQAEIMLLTTCREGSVLTSFKADGWMDSNAYVSQRTSGPIQQTPPPPEQNMDRRQIHMLTAVTAQKVKSVIDPSTFSSWRKLIRVTARIRRLAEKIRLRKFRQHQREFPKSLQKQRDSG